MKIFFEKVNDPNIKFFNYYNIHRLVPFRDHQRRSRSSIGRWPTSSSDVHVPYICNKLDRRERAYRCCGCQNSGGRYTNNSRSLIYRITQLIIKIHTLHFSKQRPLNRPKTLKCNQQGQENLWSAGR